MASDPGASSCESDPNFAVVCAFLEKFGTSCGLTNIDFVDLQAMLENTEEVPKVLIDLHVKLIRKARKSVAHEKWERVLTKLCYDVFESEDARQLETFGYKNSKLSSKIRILKNLLEMQFDYHNKFKNEINKMSADELRSEPLGRDKLGNTYWFQSDDNYQIRIYKEDSEDETWKLVARDKESLVALISELDGESKLSSDSAANDDSSSLTEKPIMDTGQNDTSSSDLKKTSEESENSSDSKKDEVKEETDGTDVSEKAEDLSLVKDFSSENFEEKLPKLIIKPIEKVENSHKDGVVLEDPSKTATRETKGAEIGEAIEEPVMHVTGEGSGVENETVNPIIGETIEEEVMYIFGEGSGVENMTGNGNDDDKNHDSEKSSTICSERRASNEGESLNDPSNSIINERISKHDVMEIDNNGSEISSPTKSPYKLGTIIDTKTKTDCKQTIPRPRKSRWDVETTVQIDGEDDCAEAKTDEEEGKSTEDSRVTQTLTPPPPPSSSPPKKQMFFFGPSSTFNSPLNENFCSFGFSPKANKTSQLEGEGEKREAERGDISISVNDSNCEEKKGSDDSTLLEEKNPPAESDHNVEHSNHNETKKIDFSTSQLDSAKNDSFEEIVEVNSLLKSESESENIPNSKPDTNSTAHHDHEECKDQITASKDRDGDEKSTATDPVEQTPKDDPVELEIKKRPDCEIDTNTDINSSIASQKEDQIVNEHGGAVELLVNEDSLKKIDNKPFRIVDYSSDDDSLSSAGSKVTCIRDQGQDREENKVSNSGSDLTDVTQSVDRGQGVENPPNNSLENDEASRADHVVEKEEKTLAEVPFEEDKCDDRIIETDVGKDSSSEEEEHEKSVQQIEGREKKSPEKEDVIQRVETPEKVNLADVPEEISSEDLSGADPDKNEDVPSVSSHSDEVSTSAKEISVNSIEEPIDMSNISSSKEENEAVNCLDAAEEENVSSKIFNDDTDAVSDRGSGTKSNKEESENEKEAENPLDDAEQKKVSSKIDEQAGEVHLKTDNEEENGLDVTKQEDASSKIHDDDDDIDMIEESKNDNLLPQPQEGMVCSEAETEDQSSLNAAKQEDTSPGILDGVDMINLKSTKEESENIVTEKEAENPLEDAEQKKVSSKIDEQDGGVRLETENEAKSDLDVAKQEDASSKILDDDVDMITIKTSKEESKNEPLPQNEEVVLEVENKTENPLDDAKAKQELVLSEIIEKNDNNSPEIRNVMSEVETNLEKMFEDNDTDAKDTINAVENDDENSKSVEQDSTEAILEGTKKESQIILNNQEITALEKTDKVDKSSPDNDKDEHSDISSDDGCDDVGGADQAYESDNYENEDSAEKNLEEDGGSRKGNICEKEKITVVPLKEEESRIDNKSTTTDIKSVPKTMRLRSKKEVKPSGSTEVDGVKESLLSTDKEEVYNCDIQEPDSKRFKANPDKDEVPEESETSLADVAEMKDQVVIPKKQSKKKEKETRSTVRTRQKQREIVTDDPDVVKKTVPENNDKSDNKKRARPEPVPEEPVEVVNLIDEPEIAPERPKRNHNKKGQNNKIQTTENDNKTNNIEVINKKAKLTKQQPPQATEVRVTRATRSSNKTEPSNATDENVITGRVKNSGLDSTPAPASKKSKKKVKSSNSTPVSGTTPIPSPQTVMSVTLDCENTVGSSSDVEVVQEKDPLAVSESDQESPQSKPMTLSTFSMDFDECAVMIPEIPRRVLRKRGREPEDNGPIDIGVGAKKPKLKGKRSVDVQMRKNVEEQKSIEISSSSDEEGDDVGVAEKIKPKGKQMRKSVDEQKCIQIISSEEDNATVVPSAAKKAPKKGKKGKTVAESKTTSSKINTETKPDKEKMIQNRNKRLLANLGINSDDISSLTEVPSVRQSRRIAQIRIKEDAEKTHHKKGGKPDVVKPAKESKESKEYKGIRNKKLF